MTEPADNPDAVLRMERTFDAPPALVFAMFTRPELVRIWFAASHGFRATDVRMDARPGGRWSLTNVKGETVEHVAGTFHEVRPPHRLVWSEAFTGTDFHTTISVDLDPVGQGTRMRFRQTGFPDRSARDDHEFGWSAVLRMMSEALTGASGAVRFAAPPERLDDVARDLEAARERFEREEA